MPRPLKFLIGLAATLLMGWLHHGPMGRGEALVGGLERQARAAVAATELPGVEVRLGRDPLSRAATLSGPANDVQRRGMGEQQGLNGVVGGIEGVSRVEWADEPRSGWAVPLLLETLLALLLAYLVGLGLGWFLWGRRRSEDFD